MSASWKNTDLPMVRIALRRPATFTCWASMKSARRAAGLVVVSKRAPNGSTPSSRSFASLSRRTAINSASVDCGWLVGAASLMTPRGLWRIVARGKTQDLKWEERVCGFLGRRLQYAVPQADSLARRHPELRELGGGLVEGIGRRCARAPI